MSFVSSSGMVMVVLDQKSFTSEQISYVSIRNEKKEKTKSPR